MTIERAYGGHIVLIDEPDVYLLDEFNWCVDRGRQTFYLRTYGKALGQNRPRIHRLILQPESGYVVDHINGNGLDNRRSNLRVATHQQNNCNRVNSKSGKFIGVHADMGGFKAIISSHGKSHYGGWAKTPEIAARFYDKKARELHGEFARLNFPDELV